MHQKTLPTAAKADLTIPPPPQGFDPLLVLFYDIHFRVTNPKIFLKAPIYTIFEGERAKRKNAYLTFFFQNLLATQIFGHNRDLIVFCECSENQLGRPKKTVISNCTKLFTNHESE